MSPRYIRRRYMPKETVLFTDRSAAISYDQRNGFICIDWKGLLASADQKKDFERVIQAIYSKLSQDLIPDLQIFRRNFYRLIHSLNNKWRASYLINRGELSIVCFPSDLISGSALSYVFEKYRLPEA